MANIGGLVAVGERARDTCSVRCSLLVSVVVKLCSSARLRARADEVSYTHDALVGVIYVVDRRAMMN